MLLPRAEFFRRAARWLVPVSLLALVPKCVLCVIAYAGMGAALGLGGSELCGAEPGVLLTWASAFTWLGAGGGIVLVGLVAWGGCGWRARAQASERKGGSAFS